jgi:hypothetical protein
MGRVASRLRGCLAVTALLLTCSGALAGQGAQAAASPAERRAVEQATRLIEAGRATDASRALQDFLAREPISPTALALLVDLHGSEGDIAPVLPWLERAASRDASEPRIQRLWVSSLVRAGFGDSARTVARRWVQSAPSLAEAHLAVTDAALAGADTSTAIRVLAEARGSVEDERAVLERLADLYAASGDRSGLLESWEALLLLGEPGIVAMVEDARSGAWPRGVAGDLWDALLRRAPAPSIRNGAHAALRLGTGEVSRRLARAAEPGEGADRSRFLRSYVGEATDAGLPEEVAWAADELARLSTRPVDRQRWQAVSADMALMAGDTLAARRTFQALLDESEPGEAAHRLASRRLFSVLASSPRDLSEAAGLWASHRGTYSDSALDLARMAAELSRGRARAGALREAERGLQDARASLPSAEARAVIDAAGARLAILRGAPDSALARLARATTDPGDEVVEHTRNLGLLAVLEGADALEIELLGEALQELLGSPGEWDPTDWLGRFAALPASASRPALLALLADELESAGRAEQGTAVLHRIVDEFPGSAQSPDALLSLAQRATLTRPGSARTWLERLITTYPESALAPLARRLLAELDATEPPG